MPDYKCTLSPDQLTGYTGKVSGVGYEDVRRFFGDNPDPNAYGSHAQRNVDALVMPSGGVYVNMASGDDVPPFDYKKVDLGTKGRVDGAATTVTPEQAALMHAHNVAIVSNCDQREITKNQEWALKSMVPWNANLASAGAAAAGTTLPTPQLSPLGKQMLNSPVNGR
jgi:hypothetical protein